MSSIVSRWSAKLTARKALLARAQASVKYWARRAGSTHGRQMLEEAKARRALRDRQVLEAEKVLERHGTVDTVSEAGVAFVAGFEGFRAYAYMPTPNDRPTIGYGETQGISMGMGPWTRAFALARLRTRINHDYLSPVLLECKAAGFTPTQGQADAFASLAYNLGPGVFQAGHTMGDALRSRDRARIAAAFLVYDKQGRTTLPGLSRRRRAERAMFLRP